MRSGLDTSIDVISPRRAVEKFERTSLLDEYFVSSVP
jgi:hypothetical protein